MTTELPELLVDDASAWRAWLERSHDDHDGMWVVLHKKSGTVTALTYAQALDEALCFGWIDGQKAKRDEHTYRQRFTPRRRSGPWSARNVDHVARLIETGRMRSAGLAAVEAAQADGRWDAAYQGQSNAQVPGDLAEVLATNPAAKATFERLTAANRYSII